MWQAALRSSGPAPSRGGRGSRAVGSTAPLRLGLLLWLALGGGGAGAAEPPAAIVLVVVDTLRADHLGVYGARRPTSPRLDALARRGAVFERALAPSPWTLPTMGSLLTGLLPAAHGAGALLKVGTRIEYAPLRAAPPTLGERLAAQGYATHAVAGNPNLDPRFGTARGFATYDFVAGDMHSIRRCDEVVDNALRWIGARRGQPFFLMVHCFDPHMDYDPPPAVRGRFTAALPAGRLTLPFADLRGIREGRQLTAEEQAFVAAAYDEEVAFVDEQIGRLVDGLQDLGLWARTLLVFTADHGEELWDHGGFEHGHTLYDELVRVPLIVWGPAVRPGRRREAVSLIDVMPTLLDAAGAAPAPAAGVSLWPALTGGVVLPARTLIVESPRYGAPAAAVVRWPLKAVLPLEYGPPRLFDLARDPREQRDLAAQDPMRVAALRAVLDAHRARAAAPAGPAALDAATRERLRALGYVE